MSYPVGPVDHFSDTHFTRTTGAAVVVAFGLDSMADNWTAAMMAFGSHLENSAFETVEHVDFTIEPDLHTFVILVSTGFALVHTDLQRGPSK
jgi:hypothetical protein